MPSHDLSTSHTSAKMFGEIALSLSTASTLLTSANHNPAKGTGDTDNMYLLTLGYNLHTTRKR